MQRALFQVLDNAQEYYGEDSEIFEQAETLKEVIVELRQRAEADGALHWKRTSWWFFFFINISFAIPAMLAIAAESVVASAPTSSKRSKRMTRGGSETASGVMTPADDDATPANGRTPMVRTKK